MKCGPLLAIALVAAVASAEEPRRPADHVIIVMLDGTRPDILRRADAPVIHGLADAGVSYVQARTTYPSQTRVSFVTLPTGSYPGHHGITGGEELMDPSWHLIDPGDEDPIAAQSLVKRPTFFEEATAAGLTSLYSAMKGYELVGARGATWTINGKHTLDPTAYKTRYDAEVLGSEALAAGYKQLLSRQILDQSLAIIREKKPSLVVINLAAVDYAGHTYGPDHPRYIETIHYVDGLVGDLLKALDALGIRERTALIISADHGFSGVNAKHLVAPESDTGGHRLQSLAALGIEHFLTNSGGTSAGIYIRDKSRVKEAVAALRKEYWCEAVYCEDATAGCDMRLSDLGNYMAGRSPDIFVDVDDDVALNEPRPGLHGSHRESDMRIPLILSGAGIAKGKIFGKAVLVDVAPTAVRLLGLPQKVLRPDGRVLAEALAP